MEKLKNIKIDVTFNAVLSVILGVLLIVWPATVITMLARVIAVILVISGLFMLIPKLLEAIKSYPSIIVSILIIVIGVWMFLNPAIVASVIPMVIGALMVVHGLQDLSLSIEGKSKKASNWWTMLLMGALNVFFGILCIANAFGLVKLAMIFIGIMLVYDGLTDMIIVHKVNKATREYVDSTITKEEDIDDFV